MSLGEKAAGAIIVGAIKVAALPAKVAWGAFKVAVWPLGKIMEWTHWCGYNAGKEKKG